MSQPRAAVTFPIGGMWEAEEFTIQLDEPVPNDTKPCPHYRRGTVRITTFSGATEDAAAWICPRVVVAANEGGYCTTGVCLDCILDAARTLGPADGGNPCAL